MKKLMSVCVVFVVVVVSGLTEADVKLVSSYVGEPPGGQPYIFSNAVDGYSFELQIGSNPVTDWEWHVPIFELTNTSTNDWADIIGFEFTIGDTDYNFDHLGVVGRDNLPEFSTDLNNDGSYPDNQPDNYDGFVRSDYISFEFTGFDKGDAFVFMADVDIDSALEPGSVEDFREVFWGNGPAPNSEITVTFVPVPGSGILLGMGAAFLGWFRRRRTQ